MPTSGFTCQGCNYEVEDDDSEAVGCDANINHWWHYMCLPQIHQELIQEERKQDRAGETTEDWACPNCQHLMHSTCETCFGGTWSASNDDNWIRCTSCQGSWHIACLPEQDGILAQCQVIWKCRRCH